MKRRFLISFADFPISKKDVKNGTNKPNIVTACRCVNVGLFLSHDMRRDVEVHLLIGPTNNMKTIVFPGDTLRRVAPDERSVSFFILKAHNTVEKLQMQTSTTLDNGIIVSRGKLDDFLAVNNQNGLCLARKMHYTNFGEENTEQYADYLYESKRGYLGSFDRKSRLISRPPHPERMILDVNIACDKGIALRNLHNAKSGN